MSEYHDNEEIIEQESITESEATAQEALRGTSHTKITRIYTGAADAEDKSEASTEQEEAVEKKSWFRRTFGWLGLFATGRILLHNDAKRVYNLFILLGAVFLLSILTIFAHLQKDLHWNKLQKEVEVLRDRAARTAEIRTECTSHTAITKQLKERNIDLKDPQKPPATLK